MRITIEPEHGSRDHMDGNRIERQAAVPGDSLDCRRRPDVEPVRRLELSRLLAGISVDSARRQVWDGDSETATEILGGCIDAQIVDGGPEIELTTG